MLLQTGDLQVIVGDAARNGIGGRQYCGLWSLTSRHYPFNAFGNSYAGLIPGEIRGKEPRLEPIDATGCALVREADAVYPVAARAEYRLRPPYAVDHVLILTDQADVRPAGCDFREVTWCSYMNCPEDSRLHFISRGDWAAYISPAHGVGSNLAPSYLDDAGLERWPARQPAPGGRSLEPFHWDRAAVRFDQPFYYGRLGRMVLIFVFDTPEWLRFYCSPSGGGRSLLDGRSCPAWDFEWVIPAAAYRVGKTYRFRVSMIYKPFVSNEDVLAEVATTQRVAATVAGLP